jgi:uncharacterized protein (DUF342 family)
VGIDLISDSVQLKIKDNGMTALLVPTSAITDSPSTDELLQYLKENGILNGILHEIIEELVPVFEHWHEPIVIARGTKPIKGQSGYIRPVLQDQELSTDMDARYIDLRSTTYIQSVKQGDLIAEIIHHTNGTDGISVTGDIVKAKPGKPIRVKKTKNIRIDEVQNKIYALTDGQVSYQKRSVHVFPVYEVQGDLDLKTGNLTFTGNIHIHGDVPSGYKITADGDVRIAGAIEASDIKAGGSVFIRDGIAGQGKGKIEAGCDVRTGHINQGNVVAGGDLHVGLINHSQVQVDGNIFCQNGKGIIHGGTITSGGNIHVNQAGNDLMTKTLFYFGVPPHIIHQHDHLSKKIQEEEENLRKLSTLQHKIEMIDEKLRTTKERILLLRIKNTFIQSESLIEQLKLEFHSVLQDFVEVTDLSMYVKDVLYPGVEVTFGKYKRVFKSDYKSVELKLSSSEVIVQPLK